ncbi:MAG: hypothetical protein AAB587_00440 [Patescibacteria group bacterium]
MRKGIIISVVALAIFAALWWYVSSVSPAPSEETGTVGESGFSLRKFFPFGQGSTGTENPTGNTADTGNTTVEENVAGLPVPDLRKVSESPVAGAVAIGTGTSTVIRYLDKGTGHIYDTGTNSLAQEKVSNTTIPKVHSALWLSKGESLVMRYVRDDRATVESFYAKLTASKTQGNETLKELEGVFLQKNIKEISVSPNKTRIFSLIKNGTKGTGVISLGDGSKKTSFDLPFYEFTPYWGAEGSITLTTKASVRVLGYAYTLNTSTGSFSKLFGGVSGLTTRTNNDGAKVLFADNSLALSVFDTAKGGVSSLPLKTLPEKCVWSSKDKNTLYCAVPISIPMGDYPDAWYQGVVSFSDGLWKINILTGETTLVADFGKQGKDIDATELLLTPQENFLVFLNKKDSSLWILKIVSEI